VNKHRKAILVLALAQILCLACGLWVRDRFLLATVKWQTENQARAQHDQIPIDPPPQTKQATDSGDSDAQEDVRGRDPQAIAQQATDQPSSNQQIDPGLEHVQAAMPLVMVLTLVWIGGLQAIAAYLVLTRLFNESSRNQEQSRMRLLSREKDLVRTRNAVIFGLAKLAEYRDKETGQHLERIALFATCLTTALRRDPRFRDAISATFVKTIGISSVLHDIGKVGLPDSILCKAGPLTDVERGRMESHTAIGAECIRQIEQRLGNCNFLQMARQIAMCHHERWDGTGYPSGLAGSDIPLAARIVAIVDVYDALVSKRCYKDAMPHEKCVSIILESAGNHLDPALVDVFRRVEPQFWEIASRYADRKPQAKDPPSVQRTIDSKDHDKLISSILDQGEADAYAAAN